MNKPSKSDQLYRLLTERVSQLGDGERFPTLREIMKEYQVSQFTAAPALKRLQDGGLIASHVGRGTVVVRNSKPRKDARIVYLQTDWPSNSIAAMEKAMVAEVLARGYRCDVQCFPPDADIYRRLPDYEADALILNPISAEHFSAEQLQILTGSVRPIVLCRPTLPVLNIKCVGANFMATGLSTFNYLYRKGHRNIAILLSEHRSYTANMLIDTMRQCAETLDCSLTVLDVHVEHGMDSRVMTREYLEKHFPAGILNGITALYVYGYETAVVTCNYLLEQGVSIPDDLSLMSYGFCSIPDLRQEITSITSPLPKQATAVLDIIDHHLAGEFDYPAQVTIAPEIIECNSVATITPKTRREFSHETETVHTY